MCTKYGYSLDSLQHLFHSLIIPLFTYGISVWGVASYERYLSKIDKFQKRTVRFGFLKEATLILRAPVRKNQTYRGTGGKFDFFHIVMLDRLGYNYNHCMFFSVKYPFISEINCKYPNSLKSPFETFNFYMGLKASRAKTVSSTVF